MNKIIITSVVISKGFDNQPALRFSENRDSVRFKVGEKVYDKRAKDNHRWINLGVKAFGQLAQRIDKMNLKEGSYVNLSGRLDEDVWDDNGTTRRATVVILDDIEFCYSGGNGKSQKDNDAAAPSEASDGFTGFESFGGNDLY
jgi:single-stranded DNA-binding protein